MDTTLTVYTSEFCSECRSTKGEFSRRGVSFLEIDVNETPGAIAALKSMGYKQLPVVVTDDDRWSGHRLDKILAHISKLSRNVS